MRRLYSFLQFLFGFYFLVVYLCIQEEEEDLQSICSDFFYFINNDSHFLEMVDL